MRRGADGLTVRQGERFAVYLDSVPVHFDWTRARTVQELRRKAGIDAGQPSWSTHKVKSWVSSGNTLHELEAGFCRRLPPRELGAGELVLMAEHLARRLDLDGWPAYRVNPMTGALQRNGTAARCLHALMLLDLTGRLTGHPEWQALAARGISHAVAALGDPGELRFEMPDHVTGPVAEAALLLAVSRARHPALSSPAIGALAARIGSWIRPDGSLRPDGVVPSRADQDFLPSIALMALSAYWLETDADPDVDWNGIRSWYRRRAELVRPWGVMAWHAQVWAQVGDLTGGDEHYRTSVELASWMADHQLSRDGSFLTDMYECGASFHTAFAAEGVAAGWRSAVLLGDESQAGRLERSWHAAMTFMDRLLVHREDTFWMADPAAAYGAVRLAPACSDLRVDYTSHTMMALAAGLSAGDLLPALSTAR
jgi:hypothetical protein